MKSRYLNLLNLMKGSILALAVFCYSAVPVQAALPDVGVDLSALTTDITTYITTGLLGIVALGIVVRLVFKMARKATSAI